jgi:hypothetical protein
MASAATVSTRTNVEPARVLIRWERKGTDVFVEARIADDGTFAWSARTQPGAPLTGCTGIRSQAECVARAAIEAGLVPGRALKRVI